MIFHDDFYCGAVTSITVISESEKKFMELAMRERYSFYTYDQVGKHSEIRLVVSDSTIDILPLSEQTFKAVDTKARYQKGYDILAGIEDRIDEIADEDVDKLTDGMRKMFELRQQQHEIWLHEN